MVIEFDETTLTRYGLYAIPEGGGVGRDATEADLRAAGWVPAEELSGGPGYRLFWCWEHSDNARTVTCHVCGETAQGVCTYIAARIEDPTARERAWEPVVKEACAADTTEKIKAFLEIVRSLPPEHRPEVDDG